MDEPTVADQVGYDRLLELEIIRGYEAIILRFHGRALKLSPKAARDMGALLVRLAGEIESTS